VEFDGVLDLTSADTRGFEALESGTYDCELFEYKWDSTKGGTTPDGREKKMPEGTPLLKLQFKVIEPEFENRRLFDQFVIPPNDYDPEKRDKMLGALVRFFVAMGMEESEVKSKKFKMNETLDNLIGEPVKVTVGQEAIPYGARKGELSNPVKGYKRITADDSVESKLL
jgi:Protein of unknown function (DUF669)